MSSALRIGQRVWVVAYEGRVFGRIASLSQSSYDDSVRFVVLLEDRPAVVTCLAERQGTQWDFATDSADDG